jgi:hypothetical protein
VDPRRERGRADLTAPVRFRDRLAHRFRAGAARDAGARPRVDTALVVLAAAGFGLWIAMWAVLLANSGFFGRFYGQDLAIYLDAADRWLHGGGFYHAYQLAGPYPVAFGDILYPPPSLALFVPFTVFPVAFWWAIPVALVGASVWRLRPAPWALVGIVACLWWPDTIFRIILGNPVIWVVAFLALGATRPFFAPFALLKFTLAPAALLNVRSRAWWIGLAAFGAVSLLFLPMWPDYLRALANLRVDAGWAYSLRELPLIAIPWIAWLGRARAT